MTIFGATTNMIFRYRVHKAVNWNKAIDEFTQMFWAQNLKQFWTDEEYIPSKDRSVWNNKMSNPMKKAYKRVLAGLTLLDTKQANVGMPNITDYILDLQRKAVLSFMGMMEHIHAKSYSTIFTTIIEEREIDELFDWVEENKHLQTKADIITSYYDNINDKKSLYMAMVASVFLESFLFYSGFFLPLWLSGGGDGGVSKMVASGEIIKKIVQDESIHGVYVGLLAQELFEELTPQEQEEVTKETFELLDKLMENEKAYTEYIYDEIGLTHEVKTFIKYNANKALDNLGFDNYYEGAYDINPIVENALRTESENNDQFSTKGKSYVKAIHRALTDEDFSFGNRTPLLTV